MSVQKNGTPTLYVVTGMTPDYVRNRATADSVATLMWHELLHPFVNPLTRKARGTVRATEALFDAHADTMRRNAYRTWETCINEYVVRTLTILITEAILGESVARSLMEYDLSQGFACIDELVDSASDVAKRGSVDLPSVHRRLMDHFTVKAKEVKKRDA